MLCCVVDVVQFQKGALSCVNSKRTAERIFAWFREERARQKQWLCARSRMRTNDVKRVPLIRDWAASKTP